LVVGRDVDSVAVRDNTHFISARVSEIRPTIVRDVRDFWFRFFQKHQIWRRCRPYHTISIFDGRQDGRPPGPPYWQNPIWPPPGLEVNAVKKPNGLES
jgi:hypothetical protein